MSLRSLAVLATLALPLAAAHADTFSGSASFSDNGPKGNGLNYTGVFDHSSFSFSGPVGTTYTDGLTITANQNNSSNTSDNIGVSLTFSLPGTATGTISGTGTNTYSFFGVFENNKIDWTNNSTYINFSNGAQLLATLPDFNFGLFASDCAQGSEDLTLKVTRVAATPEPSSLMLLGSGILGTCGIIRRRLAR